MIAVGISVSILSFIGMILNGSCICILRTSKSLKTRGSSLLILNLLFLHLGQSVVVLPFWALHKMEISNFIYAKYIANAWRFTYILSFYGTTISVFLISLDRFLATFLLNRYKNFNTMTRMKIAILSLWTYVFALCCIPFIPEVKNGISQNLNETHHKPQKWIYIPQKPWIIFMLSFNAALPYILILICYIYIVRKLDKMKLLTDKEDTHDGSSIMLNTHQNMNSKVIKKDLYRYKYVTRLTLALSIAYGIFWSPSIFYYITLETCSSCFPKDWNGSYVKEYVRFIVKYCAFTDAIAAPLIYCFTHSEFRKELRRMKIIVLHHENSSYILERTEMVSYCYIFNGLLQIN